MIRTESYQAKPIKSLQAAVRAHSKETGTVAERVAILAAVIAVTEPGLNADGIGLAVNAAIKGAGNVAQSSITTAGQRVSALKKQVLATPKLAALRKLVSDPANMTAAEVLEACTAEAKAWGDYYGAYRKASMGKAKAKPTAKEAQEPAQGSLGTSAPAPEVDPVLEAEQAFREAVAVLGLERARAILDTLEASEAGEAAAAA